MKVITNYQISTTNNKNSVSIKPHTSKYTDKRINLENSLNQLSFLGKTGIHKTLTKTEFLKKHSLLLDDWAYTDNIEEFISGLKDGSKELQDADTFLECFDSRKYDPKFGEPSFYITPRAKNLFNSFRKGRELPQGLSDDLTMIRQGGSVIDNYIPVLSQEEALSTKKIGDLFQIGEKDRVCILNRKGEIEELKMTRADCIRLFPPVERMCNIQPKEFGNCYEETAMHAIMSNPETRENMLRCVDTVSDKYNAIITFPNGFIKDGIEINEGEITINEGRKYYTQGCMGMMLIQHALGLEYEQEFIDYTLKKLKSEGKDLKAKSIANMLTNKSSNQLARYFNGPILFQSLGTNLRDGGYTNVAWYKMGLTNTGFLTKNPSQIAKESNLPNSEIENKRFFADFYFDENSGNESENYATKLKSSKFFKTHLIEATVNEENTKSNFVPNHSYKLSAKFNSKGEIEHYLIKNPWELCEHPLSYDELVKQFDNIRFAQII